MEVKNYESVDGLAGYDIKVDQVGYEVCEPLHSYGPAVRQHYLIHYISKGKGTFSYGGKTIALRKGELFLILPNEVTFYTADDKSPWEYYWLGVSGNCAMSLLETSGFTEENRKIKYELGSFFSIDETIKQLTRMKIMSESDKLYETAKVYEIFSWLIKSNQESSGTGIADEKDALINAACEYIKRSYTRQLAVTDIARHIGVDRTQLYRYFMSALNISPQDYIIEVRMKEAQKLLRDTGLSVKQVAYSVGYKDQYLFSKMFKKIHGVSPKSFRLSG